LLGDGQGNKGQASFWTFRFYQQFFDVETDQVKTRILYSMFPKPGHSYLDYHVRPKPDLYGNRFSSVANASLFPQSQSFSALMFSRSVLGLRDAGLFDSDIWKHFQLSANGWVRGEIRLEIRLP
jgi:hypothetical protein